MPLAQMKVWTLRHAASFIAALQPIASEQGFHLALAGGVLNKGASQNDLDIILCPYRDLTPTVNNALAFLTSLKCYETVTIIETNWKTGKAWSLFFVAEEKYVEFIYYFYNGEE